MLKRLPGYVQGWHPKQGDPGWALLQIYARYLQSFTERLNLTPDKSKLAFFDMLGVNLLPAQAARAPLVFRPIENVGHGSVPAGTQVGAESEAADDSIIFETEKNIALAASPLAELVSVWPGKDSYVDHTADMLAGNPFTLFEQLKPIPHEFYFAHDMYLALAGETTLHLEFTLTRPSSEPIKLRFTYWDGEVWRDFTKFADDLKNVTNKDSVDGTNGLTQNGTIRLYSDCAEAKKTKVNGIESYWVRCEAVDRLLPLPGKHLPQIDQMKISLITKRDVGVAPFDKAFSDATELDLSKTFYPFGQNPGAGDVFYLNHEEAFSKPNAMITMIATTASSQISEEEVSLEAEYWNGKKWKALEIGKSETRVGSAESEYGNISQFHQAKWRNFLEVRTLTSVFVSDSISSKEVRLRNLISILNLNSPSPKDGKVALIDFKIPSDLNKFKVNEEEGLWIRVRITSGAFGKKRTIRWKPPDLPRNRLQVFEPRPPILKTLNLGYVYESPKEQPQFCMTQNDSQWEVVKAAGSTSTQTFFPFKFSKDKTPALYFGFKVALPKDHISCYLDIIGNIDADATPLIVWEVWDGSTWKTLSAEDETNNFESSGMVQFIYPGIDIQPLGEVISAAGELVELPNAEQAAQFSAQDQVYIGNVDEGELAEIASVDNKHLTLSVPLEKEYSRVPVEVARFPRFGTPRTWIRARLHSDVNPLKSNMNLVAVNAVWASQIQTTENEIMGSSFDQSGQSFFFRSSPVLEGEVIEVRELQGARAEIELPILQQQLQKTGHPDDAVRVVKDRIDGRVNEVWVRWQRRPNFFFSKPTDRHYTIERSRGRLIFGDNLRGMVPPAGTDNILARHYRYGGGETGNVPAGAINQLLSGVLAESVSNPIAAEGGATDESIERLERRAPWLTRHQGQAVSQRDYEHLALQASPSIAMARVLPNTHKSGRKERGWVSIIVLPHSKDPRPQPSFQLRRHVQQYLESRTPASLSTRINIIGPTYLPIGCQAVVVPKDPEMAGEILENAVNVLNHFFHPLHGGPEGQGWPFGRNVYLSDVASVLESVPGLDYVENLVLTKADTPQPEVVQVPTDQIVVAGNFNVRLKTAERV
jgi:hypothetical protein